MSLHVTVKQYASKAVQFFEQSIIVRLDCHKLKFFIDITFITIEKIISKLSKLIPLYIAHYQDTIRQEIKLAHLTGNHHILDIGCGSIPASCVLFVRETNAKVTGLDKNPASVKRAKKIISQLKLENRIDFLQEDARNVQLNAFDIILIVNGIHPYEAVLEHIAKQMQDDTVVIFRVFLTQNEELGKKDYFLKNFFEIGQKTFHKKTGGLGAVLLYKKTPKQLKPTTEFPGYS